MRHEPKPLQRLKRKESFKLFIKLALGFLLLVALTTLFVPYRDSTVRLETAIPAASTLFRGWYPTDPLENPSYGQGIVETNEPPQVGSPSSNIVPPASPKIPPPPPPPSNREEEKSHGEKLVLVPEKKPLCNASYSRTVVCELEGDVRIYGNSTIHSVSVAAAAATAIAANATNTSWRVKPYARKGDTRAMAKIQELIITELQTSHLRCEEMHTVPAVVFSTGGYQRNVFHDYAEVLVPLFITAHRFSSEVQFLVTNFKSWWVLRYKPILDRLSHYDVIDLDTDHRVHCFPRAIVGLKRHNSREFSIDPSPPPGELSLKDFARFLRSAFSLPRTSTGAAILKQQQRRPRLLIISRLKTRKLVNLEEVVKVAEEVGFEVVVAEGSSPGGFARAVNSCDMVLGVHGAGLTNMVFLPEGAVVMQVVPLGGLKGLAKACFGHPAEEMGLRYLEYEITEEESTLVDMYPGNRTVLRDPQEFFRKGGWVGFSDLFLRKQDVRLDLRRLGRVLSEAAMELQ